jgi:hypothetical protein
MFQRLDSRNANSHYAHVTRQIKRKKKEGGRLRSTIIKAVKLEQLGLSTSAGISSHHMHYCADLLLS